MELYQDSEKFIILSGEDSLWCNRGDARLQPRFGTKLVFEKLFLKEAVLLFISFFSDLYRYQSFVYFVLTGVKLGDAWPLKCCGIIYGVIGKIQFFPGELIGYRVCDIQRKLILNRSLSLNFDSISEILH